MISFRTRGNFIDFVLIEDTSLQDEHVLLSLHNTSKAVDWSFDENPLTITFTINEQQYSNIPIATIDFDGTTLTTQGGFETGIEAMFPNLSNEGGGGSSYLVKAEKVLTNDEIKASPSGVLNLIPVVGAGKFPLFVRAVIKMSITTPYTNIDAAGNAFFKNTGDVQISGDIPNDAGTFLTSFTALFTTNGELALVPPYGDTIAGWYDVIAQLTDVITNENKGIDFYVNNGSSGNFTGGHANNTMKIILYYTVVDL